MWQLRFKCLKAQHTVMDDVTVCTAALVSDRVFARSEPSTQAAGNETQILGVGGARCQDNQQPHRSSPAL